MALTKITSRILDSSGVTILGTIATGVWQGSVIAEAYLQNQSGTNTGDQTNISGNAGTATLADEATILANTRNINGVAFNGSTNITIADATKLPLAGGTLTGQLTGTTANLIGTIKSTLASDNSYYSLFSNNGSLVLDTAGVNSGMQFKILGSTKLTMSNSGNVGIGTTSPSSYDAEGDNLVVYDAVTPGITIALPQTTAAGSARGSVLFSDGTSGSEKYRGGVIYDHGTGMGGIADTMYIRAAINSYLVLGPTGNIGIGTKTPDGSDWNSNSRLLHIYQNTTNGSLLKLESSNTSLVVASGNSQAQIGTVEAKPLKFYTNTTERMSIGTSTNTLVLKSAGTTGGNYLQFQNSSSTVQGYVGYGSSGSNTLYLAQQAANSDIVMYNGGQSRLTISSGGIVLIGTTNADVGGSVQGIRLGNDGRAIFAIDTGSLPHYISPVGADRRNNSGDGNMFSMWRQGIFKGAMGITGNDIVFKTGNNSSDAERMRIASDGRVTIQQGLTVGTDNTLAGSNYIQGDVYRPGAASYMERIFNIASSSSGSTWTFARQFHDHVNWGQGNINVIIQGTYYGTGQFFKGDFTCRYGYGGGNAYINTNFNGGVPAPTWQGAVNVGGNIHYRNLIFAGPAYQQFTVRIILTGGLSLTSSATANSSNLVWIPNF